MKRLLARSSGDAALRMAPVTSRPGQRCVAVHAIEKAASSSQPGTIPQALAAADVQGPWASLVRTSEILANTNRQISEDNEELAKQNRKGQLQLSRQKRIIASALAAAGVSEACEMLDWIELSYGIFCTTEGGRAKGWRRLLERQEQLRDSLVEAVPSWVPAGLPADDTSVPGILGDKIAEMYRSLETNIHRFKPPVGLVIRPGVPDAATSSALRCLADEFGLPWEEGELESL
ncbi:hypothetical protein HYH03_004892 [Edaphochlamys debaryana]|uniref:Uncharacterized protein n=1 Tax=Edaphochlamys debaryana TaxID=47281 RepID=A0A835Y8X9_9CHLO|nr:hypothetical protein HYH03_004892 [Edaphochlamys debaryana]|eukprot:KAG2497309.1 hypothetical protein HYH03_004892 [Edaphochlamys debaryana]